MILVASMAAALWLIGMAMGAPHRARWIMIGALFAGVLLGHLVLPDGHPLRQATGGSAAFWLMLAGFVALAAAYRKGLRWLRRRAGTATDIGPTATPGPDPNPDTLSDDELTRYARHMMLRELGGAGQMRLRRARVLVVGAGGLGSPVLLYLAAAGVGTLGVIDDDDVDASNLQRQVIHRTEWLGKPKVFSAEAEIAALNPHVAVRPYHRRLTDEIAHELISDYDLVIDGSDSFTTRALVNRACVDTETPLVSGAISQWEGQVSLFDPARGTPCYACIFPNEPAPGQAPSCAEAGVIGPLPGIIGTILATEALKALSGAGEPLLGRMLTYDALYTETREIRLSPDPACPVCAAKRS